MNIFIVTRWGNPYEEDGPDGKDTNFLVRANSLIEATRIADKTLSIMPTSVPGNRPVEAFSHFAAEIGKDTFSHKAGIIHGPWVETMMVNDSNHYPSWHREDSDGEWVNTKDLLG